MQIILLTKTGAAARVLSFGRRWPLVAGLMLGALLSAGLFRAGSLSAPSRLGAIAPGHLIF